jgi:hypothetical protein
MGRFLESGLQHFAVERTDRVKGMARGVHRDAADKVFAVKRK